MGYGDCGNRKKSANYPETPRRKDALVRRTEAAVLLMSGAEIGSIL